MAWVLCARGFVGSLVRRPCGGLVRGVLCGGLVRVLCGGPCGGALLRDPAWCRVGSCAGLVGVLCGVLCGAFGPDCPDSVPEAFELLGLVRRSSGEALRHQDFFKIGRALCHQDPPQDHFPGKSLVGVLCASWVYCAKSCGSLVRICLDRFCFSIQHSRIFV